MWYIIFIIWVILFGLSINIAREKVKIGRNFFNWNWPFILAIYTGVVLFYTLIFNLLNL